MPKLLSCLLGPKFIALIVRYVVIQKYGTVGGWVGMHHSLYIWHKYIGHSKGSREGAEGITPRSKGPSQHPMLQGL